MNQTSGGLVAFVRRKPEIWISVGYFVIYLICFFLLERLVQPRYIIHSRLDDLIPFCEWGLIPYAGWYLLVPGMLFFYLCKSRDDYMRLCFMMYIGMTICLALYLVLPSGLNLRQPITENNLLCRAVGLLRSIDTPTNVCPSIHVSSTVAIGIVGLRSRLFSGRRGLKAALVAGCVLICWSTLVLKQHSVWDVAAGVALSFALMPVTWRLWPQKE